MRGGGAGEPGAGASPAASPAPAAAHCNPALAGSLPASAFDDGDAGLADSGAAALPAGLPPAGAAQKSCSAISMPSLRPAAASLHSATCCPQAAHTTSAVRSSAPGMASRAGGWCALACSQGCSAQMAAATAAGLQAGPALATSPGASAAVGGSAAAAGLSCCSPPIKPCPTAVHVAGCTTCCLGWLAAGSGPRSAPGDGGPSPSTDCRNASASCCPCCCALPLPHVLLAPDRASPSAPAHRTSNRQKL